MAKILSQSYYNSFFTHFVNSYDEIFKQTEVSLKLFSGINNPIPGKSILGNKFIARKILLC